MRKLFLYAASVAYGDYCFNDRSISMRVALKGDRVHVDAAAPAAWVGVGVPKSPDYKEMARGQFVMGAGNQLFQYTLDMDYNWKPNKELKSVVDGTARVSSVSGYTNMSFTRMLNGNGLYSIDTTKPFNLLWASGSLKAGEQGYAALEYHQKSRGHVRVDLNTDNCAGSAPYSTGNDTHKRVRKGKTGKGLCAAGQVPCTTLLQQQGQNCVIGSCVNARRQQGDGTVCTLDAKTCPDGSSVGRVPPNCEFAPCPSDNGGFCTADVKTCPDGSAVSRVPPSCEFAPCPTTGKYGKGQTRRQADASSCAAILCQENTQCINGECVPIDKCALIRCVGQCVDGQCVDSDNGGFCTADVKTCPDGSAVSRVPPSCEFAPCPTTGDGNVICTMDAKVCPDGSSVGRVGPNCEFAPCPSGKSGKSGKVGKGGKFGKGKNEVATRRQAGVSSCALILCAANTQCVNGRCVPLGQGKFGQGKFGQGKVGKGGKFGKGKTGLPTGVVCTMDAKVCPDGSSVGRVGPNCEFAPCPGSGGVMCTMDVKTCPDGSYVGRVPPSCAFRPCPGAL